MPGAPGGDGGTSVPSVSVEFTLTKPEFTSAQRQVMLRNRVVIGVSVVMALLAIVGIISGAGSAIVFGIMWFVLFAVVLAYMPRTEWAHNPVVHRPQRHTFDEQGATLRFDRGETDVEWDYFSQALRGRALYQLVQGRRYGLVVPARAFRTRADEELFVDLVSRHVGATLGRRAERS
jgi:hypothetical protein